MMKCIIVDDEPLAREGIQLLVENTKGLSLEGCFNNAQSAGEFLTDGKIDLIFLDINMPGINGIEFAETLPEKTLLIFITAYAEYALKGYELDAVDYLVKPVHAERFQKAIDKALSYHKLLVTENNKSDIETITSDYIFIKSERKYFKIVFNDILFIEGLKDYVVIHTATQKIITAMNVKTINSQLPTQVFARISKSYIVNIRHISSFDNNSLLINNHEITIGNNYRNHFFEEYVLKKLISR
jgi:DNA-binding LytR/AlgR family response regulator